MNSHDEFIGVPSTAEECRDGNSAIPKDTTAKPASGNDQFVSNSRSASKKRHAEANPSTHLSPPLRRRFPNEIYREKCFGLPKNWVREVTVRKNGLMFNMRDVKYISPTGEIFEKKSQLVKYFGRNWDLDGFDYKTGTVNEQLKKWIKLKPQFYHDVPRRLNPDGDPGLDAPIRQTASIFKQPVSLVKPTPSTVKSEPTEGSREKPKQMLWHKRLEGLRQDPTSIELPNKIHSLSPPLVGKKSEAVGSTLRSLANSLHMNAFPITGQYLLGAGDEEENMDPTIFINPDQPLIQTVAVFDEDVQSQEEKLRQARERLAQALAHSFE